MRVEAAYVPESVRNDQFWPLAFVDTGEIIAEFYTRSDALHACKQWHELGRISVPATRSRR